MRIDVDLFIDMLNIDSTSTKEYILADFLAKRLPYGDCKVCRTPSETRDGEPYNLMLSWGTPTVTFCTHLDTVPPYIPPSIDTKDRATIIRGRGACDAKGQIISMYTACKALADQGYRDFALLLLYGEETGSFGAKEHRRHAGGEYVIVGEPTDNKMVTASKGTKAFEVTIKGKPFHSGYPEYGDSAIETFVDLAVKLRDIEYPIDPILGKTTYNIGKLNSDNLQNILSGNLTCRIYFRTTFASDTMVTDSVMALNSPKISIKALGGDSPSHYLTIPGFKTTTVAFGSDAPQLHNFANKSLCGPGTILVAHTDQEYITVEDLEKAADQYVEMYKRLMDTKPKDYKQ